MFAALLAPEVAPDLPATWARRRRPVSGGVLTRLAPGVYIVRSKQWVPATALDTNASLPPPVIEEVPVRRFPHPEWHERANCRLLEQKLFFGDGDGVRPALRRSVLARARAHCTPCATRYDCLLHALTQPEKYGIWGGTSGNDRKKLQARVRRGELVADLVSEILRGD